jgi:hypothetical protein
LPLQLSNQGQGAWTNFCLCLDRSFPRGSTNYYFVLSLRVLKIRRKFLIQTCEILFYPFYLYSCVNYSSTYNKCRRESVSYVISRYGDWSTVLYICIFSPSSEADEGLVAVLCQGWKRRAIIAGNDDEWRIVIQFWRQPIGMPRFSRAGWWLEAIKVKIITSNMGPR